MDLALRLLDKSLHDNVIVALGNYASDCELLAASAETSAEIAERLRARAKVCRDSQFEILATLPEPEQSIAGLSDAIGRALAANGNAGGVQASVKEEPREWIIQRCTQRWDKSGTIPELIYEDFPVPEGVMTRSQAEQVLDRVQYEHLNDEFRGHRIPQVVTR